MGVLGNCLLLVGSPRTCGPKLHAGRVRRMGVGETVKLNTLVIPVVMDTGCTQMMMKADLIPPYLGEEDTPINVLFMHR